MSRRKKSKAERLILPGASKTEWLLKNYMHLNNIYKGNNAMQTIIINSFYCQFFGSNDDPWKEKILVTHENFGKFASYAQNNWKHTEQNTNLALNLKQQ